MKRKLLLLTFAIPTILCQNAIAQDASRLTAEAHWRDNGAMFAPVDSSYFNYSGGRGGDLTHTLKYDNYTTWSFLGDTAYSNSWYYIQTFDSSNNNILTSTAEYWDSLGWELSTKNIYTYNSINQVTTAIMQTWNGTIWVPTTQQVYSYTPDNILYSVVYQNWNATTVNWDPASQKTYYYDGLGQMVNETDQVFGSGGVLVYTNQYAYTYDSSSKLLAKTISIWNGAGWVYDSLYTNSYDGFGDITNTLGQTYNAGTSVWENQTLHIYSNFVPSTTIPQTDIYQTWDSTGSGLWVNVMQYTNTYNSFNQMTSSTGTSWNVVGLFEFALNDPMDMYYYSTYSAAEVSVKSVVNNGGDVSIYPVPAQNMLHVDLKWDIAQTATIAIYDMQGRVVRQWDAPAGTQYNSAVSVDNLAAGVYFVKINGAQGQIVKQITVGH